jgi:Icc-related predicted phosphoesterase
MIIDCISDLHGNYPTLEGGDLLIIAGDLTANDFSSQRAEFASWLKNLNYKKIVCIAGNHDNFFQIYYGKVGSDSVPPPFYSLNVLERGKIEYLCDSGTTFRHWPLLEKDSVGELKVLDLKIWGSPWTKTFPGINPKCKAFTVDTEEELAGKFSLIPDDTDILITHGPPYGILDRCPNENVGSKSLLNSIEKVMPEMVLFGHIHEQGGKYVQEEGVLYINGSIVDERYRNVNTARTVVFDEKMPKMQRFKVIE